GERGVTRRVGDREPENGENEPCGPIEAEEAAEVGGHALTAAELQPGRKDMAGESRTGGGEPGRRSPKMKREENRGRALQPVQHKRRGREVLATGAQHVGGADIARTDGPDVACA